MIPRVFQVHVFRRAAPSPAASAQARPAAGFDGHLTRARARIGGARARPAPTPSPVAGAPTPRPSSPPDGIARGSVGPAAWLRTASRRALAGQIASAATRAGVDPELSLAVAIAESSLDPGAVSPDGSSRGTFQVTETTARELRRRVAAGLLPRLPASEDVALGLAYLRHLDDVFSRGRLLARGLRATPVADARERELFTAAAFNAGEGRVARAQQAARATGGRPTSFADVEPFLPRTTRRYVRRVLAYAGPARASA